MDIGTLVAHAVLGKALEEVVHKLHANVMKDVEPQIKSLENRLQGIEEKIDRQLAADLKAGLTFLRLGELINARDALIKAEANEPNAAAARFWLSVVLLKLGREDLAVDRFQSALQLNPFIVPRNLPAALQIPTGPNAEEAIIRANVPAVNWGKGKWLNKVKVDNAPFSGWKDRLNTYYFKSKRLLWSNLQAQVVKASASGGNLVLMWRLNDRVDYLIVQNGKSIDGVIKGGKYLVSAFSLAAGTPLWHRDLTGKYLNFATPAYAVLHRFEEPKGYELLDIHNGRVKATMSEDYFNTVFLTDDPEKDNELYDRSNVFVKVGRFEYIPSPAPNYQKKGTFRKTATDPFGLDLYSYEMTNACVYYGGKRIECNATIRRLS
jgi:tetratricopeptide (TPR) repeat protein